MLANSQPGLMRAGFLAGSTVLVLTCRAWLAIALGIILVAVLPAPGGLALTAGGLLAAGLMPYRSVRRLHGDFRAVRGPATLPFMRGLLVALFAGLALLWLALLALVELSNGVATAPASIPGILAPRIAALAVVVTLVAVFSAAYVWWRHPALRR